MELIGTTRQTGDIRARPPNGKIARIGTRAATTFGNARIGLANRTSLDEMISWIGWNGRTAMACRLELDARDVASPATIAGSNRGRAEA
jgi:hypothetical protein